MISWFSMFVGALAALTSMVIVQVVRIVRVVRRRRRSTKAHAAPLIVRASMDGMRCGDSTGHIVEIIEPRWWRLDRWLAWWKAPGRIQFCIQDGSGRARFLELRARIDVAMTRAMVSHRTLVQPAKPMKPHPRDEFYDYKSWLN